MANIQSFHAHVYFDADSIDQARALCEQAKQLFAVEMGRVHERPVGPHPMWSCQLQFEPEVFGEIMPWLALNRNGLIIFTHPETGDVIKDHSEHTIWMGQVMPLNLEVLV